MTNSVKAQSLFQDRRRKFHRLPPQPSAGSWWRFLKVVNITFIAFEYN